MKRIRRLLADAFRRVGNLLDGGSKMDIWPVDEKTIAISGSVPCGAITIHGGCCVHDTIIGCGSGLVFPLDDLCPVSPL